MPFIALLCYAAACILALIGMVGGDLGDISLTFLVLALIALGLALDRGHTYVDERRR